MCIEDKYTITQYNILPHFGSYQNSNLSVKQHKGRYSAVKSSQLSWARQYKKCVQYNLQYTPEYSDLYMYIEDKYTITQYNIRTCVYTSVHYFSQ